MESRGFVGYGMVELLYNFKMKCVKGKIKLLNKK